MTQPPDFEARLSRAETDAAAARHLAAAHDRDLSDLGVKVDANRKAINALGEQTRARFDQLEGRVDRLETKVDAGFAYMQAKFTEMDSGFAYMQAKFTEMDSGFAYMQAKFTEMDSGFAAMRHGFDQSAAGFARIAELIAARDDDR